MDHGGDVVSLFAGVFVRPDDGFQFPIGPIHVILEHGERENVRQVGGENHATVPPFQIGHHQEIFSGVAPE